MKVVLLLSVTVCCLALPVGLRAGDALNPPAHAPGAPFGPGSISADLRYRFESFEREGAPFTGKLNSLHGATATVTYYNYHSDSNRVHYGNELDWAVACPIHGTGSQWEIGSRFGRYWADRLYSDALRASIYTQWTL